MNQISYKLARPMIEDGDLITTRRVHGLFGILTFLTTGKYTHTGTAVWIGRSLWMVEINGGRNHAIPLSQLEHEDFDVYYPPEGLDRRRIKREAIESIRVRVNYGFIATVVTGIVEFFNLPIVINWRNYLHCAGYSIRIYDQAGWDVTGTHSYITSPTKLASMLRLKFRIKGSKSS